MEKYIRYILVFALLWVAGFAEVSAQNDRAFIREGNRAFRSRKWAAAETQYRKAISKNDKNTQAIYNLGCALMMQQKDSVAMQQFANSAQAETSKFRRAKSFHNMGVIMQNHREYAQAIDCYKNALRCNPTDNETRYNLALCKKLMKNQQQNKNQQNKDDKNKDNKDKNKDKDKNKNKDKNQNKDKDNKNNKDKDKNKDQNQNQQNNQDKMSRENAEQLLSATVQQEEATKRKLQKAMSQPRRKQYEKNW